MVDSGTTQRISVDMIARRGNYSLIECPSIAS